MEKEQLKTQDKTAIILGATGLTGGNVLQMLLKDTRYSKIKIFSRKGLGLQHPKLEEHIGDLLKLYQFKSDFTADEVFCCVGTTKAKTPDPKMYRDIDYGIPVSAATLCKQNNIGSFLVISALGANANSNITYNSLKGEMEEAVIDISLPKTHILQPALIAGKREEKRWGEWAAKQLMKVLNLVMVGPLAKYRSIHPESIAKAMVWLANNSDERVRIASDEIKRIGS